MSGEVRHSAISANGPVSTGIVAGSEREGTTQADTIGARLTPSMTRSFVLNELNFDNALVPGSVFLNMRCKAKTSAGADVGTNDPIALIEECSSLAFRSLELKLNTVTVSRMERADVVRNVVDRVVTSALLSVAGYRQLNSDNEITRTVNNPPTADIFKHDMIVGGKSFLLTRPLDDLPFFAEGDAYLPGWNTVNLKVTTTSDPQNLFRTDNTIADAPYLYVEEMFITYTTVMMEPEEASKLLAAANAGQASFGTLEWGEQALTPQIPAGATSWKSSVAAVFDVVPNMVLLAMFPTETFNPPADSFKTALHPMVRSWANISEVGFKSGATPIQTYARTNGVGGKMEILNGLTKMIDQNAGISGSSSGIRAKTVVEPHVFMEEPGTALIPLVYKNWGSREDVRSRSLSLNAYTAMNDLPGGAPLEVTPHMISVTRVRWNLAPQALATHKTPGLRIE